MSRKNIGLTLIEVLVVITILSVLSLSVYIVFKSGMDAWSKSEVRLDIFQNARVVLDQMSRELPGTFVGGGATFTGTNNDPDTLEFVTNFANSIYMIEYEIEAGTTILKRKYSKNPSDYTDPGYDDDTDDDTGIIEFGFKISDIQFTYCDTDTGTWTTDEGWTDTATLPAAVKIEISLKENPSDDDAKAHKFETEVYLPNSE